MSMCRFTWPNLANTLYPNATSHCSGSSWPIQRSSSTPRSAWLKINQKIAREVLYPIGLIWFLSAHTNGLQNLSRPQLLTGRDRLCERLRSSEEARFCHKMRGQGRTVQVLYKEGCCLLPWVQVSWLDKNGKMFKHHLQRFCCTLSLCTHPSSHGKSNSEFDDTVGC